MLRVVLTYWKKEGIGMDAGIAKTPVKTNGYPEWQHNSKKTVNIIYALFYTSPDLTCTSISGLEAILAGKNLFFFLKSYWSHLLRQALSLWPWLKRCFKLYQLYSWCVFEFLMRRAEIPYIAPLVHFTVVFFHLNDMTTGKSVWFNGIIKK